VKVFLALSCCVALAGALLCAPVPAGAAYNVAQCTALAQSIQRMQNQIKPGTKPADPDLPNNILLAQAQYEMNCGTSRHFVVYPKYAIVSLFYAPAGCAGTDCSGTGEVSYQSGFSSGTKLSTDKAFKNAMNLSVDATIGDPAAASASVGVSGGLSTSTTDSSSITVSLDQTLGKSWTSSKDGIDHDRDVFYLLVNSAVIVMKQGQKTWWNLGYKGSYGALIFPVTVSALKTCDFSNPNSLLYGRNLTRNDCDTILKQDPYASGAPAVDAQRFVLTGQPWPYEYDPVNCATQTITITHERDTDSTHEVEKEYTVGYSLGAGYNGVDMKFTQDFTWTNTSSTTATTGSTKTASLTLPCPSAAYTGKPLIVVYWDTLYGSFMFMPMLPSEMGLVIHQGHVSNSAGKSARHQVVQLSYGGKTYTTATNRNGDYKFFAPKNAAGATRPATGQLTVKGVKQTVPLGSSAPVQTRMPAK
jgi:hypothetical protein